MKLEKRTGNDTLRGLQRLRVAIDAVKILRKENPELFRREILFRKFTKTKYNTQLHAGKK